MRRYELVSPVNMQLDDIIQGADGFEQESDYFTPYSIRGGQCITVYMIGTDNLDESDIVQEVRDWVNLTGRWSDEEASCEAVAWAVVSDESGTPVAVDLDEFTVAEAEVLIEALEASLAHNGAA